MILFTSSSLNSGSFSTAGVLIGGEGAIAFGAVAGAFFFSTLATFFVMFFNAASFVLFGLYEAVKLVLLAASKFL